MENRTNPAAGTIFAIRSATISSRSVDSANIPDPIAPVRKLSREARRKQLMDATIEVVAARGYARTTLTEVAGRAGLSHGLANFHFKTKE